MNCTSTDSDSYISIRCLVPAALEEELPALLAAWPILGTEVGSESDGESEITIYLLGSERENAESVCGVLVEIGARGIEQRPFMTGDWLRDFRDQATPFPVGRLWWIDPHPDRPTPAPPGRRRLAVEPRTAFGSGSHESTRALLQELENIDLTGRCVLDLGTGSGILAFAAEGRGAQTVIGLDVDPEAIRVAVETARQQEETSRAAFVLGSVVCVGEGKFDVVLCNMLTSNLMPLLNDLRTVLCEPGIALISGFLASDMDTVSKALIQRGFEIMSQRLSGAWASLRAGLGAKR